MPPKRAADRGEPQRRSPEVDAYLARLPPDQRRTLENLRRTLHSALPRATERISYRIPTVQQGRVMVHFAAFENHLSFFPGSLSRFPELSRELGPFAEAKGTLRFTPERPLPATLVRRIVASRLAHAEPGRPARARQSRARAAPARKPRKPRTSRRE